MKVGYYLSQQGYILRSGHAKGADMSFEIGCNADEGGKEIYIPWKGFNNSDSELYNVSEGALRIAERFHPNWENLSNTVKTIMARNSYQILGGDLNKKVDFVLCWTPNGKGEGGTGQAIRIAEGFDIPVFDAGRFLDIDNMRNALWVFLQKHAKIDTKRVE